MPTNTQTKDKPQEPVVTPQAVALPDQAVFAGLRGAILGVQYQMPGIYNAHIYLDENGQEVTVTPEMFFTKPEQWPQIKALDIKRFYIGDLVDLPVWDEELLQEALKTGEFALPEAKEMILEVHNLANEACNKSGKSESYFGAIQQLKADLLNKGWLLQPDGGLVEPKYEGS